MKITEVLAISGKPGLYKVIASSAKNLVVESMTDGKRSSVPGSARVSSLGDITMYTHSEDLPLSEILNKMYTITKGKSAPCHKSSSASDIKDFVDSVVENLDHDRIFNSDFKKLVQWYNILLFKDAFPLKAEEEEKAGKNPTDKNNK